MEVSSILPSTRYDPNGTLVCGSDVHSFFHLPPPSPTLTQAHPITGEKLPLVMGHEFSGTIVELGKGVDTGRFAIGKNAVVDPVISCMQPTCGPCTSDKRNVCPHTTFVGIGGYGGGLAEYIAIKQEFVHVLPDSVPLDIGALIEPLSVAWHAVKVSTFTPGDSALIIGGGPIGLLVLIVLRAQDASWVGISEPTIQRRETALQLSASAAYDPRTTDIAAETFKATSGGAAVVFDCAGLQVSLDTALQAVRPKGNVVEVAVWDTNPSLDITTLQRKEALLTSSQGCNREHPEILQAVAEGKLHGLNDLITKRIRLEDLMEEGIQTLIKDKDRQIKILVHPDRNAMIPPRFILSTLAFALGLGLTAYGAQQTFSWMSEYPDLYEASIAELQDGLKRGRFTSVDLVKAYLARIDEVNINGPGLRAVLETNPKALEHAAELDKERAASGIRGPLHGIPLLLKDNIATRHEDGMETTAGSWALVGSVVPGDATVAAKLRAAGAILLGKATLSEWANWRGEVPSGFSGRIGQCTNPYVPLGNPSGSSSGSGVATAVGLAAGSLGSETDGSIISPSSHNNVVGIKPTVGLTSRAGVIPISEHQDSVGPMCRSVADAAVVLSAIVGRDPLDNYSLGQPEVAPDYTQALQKDGLKGARLGVPRKVFEGMNADTIIAFNAALDVMRGLGATIVDPADFKAEYDYDGIWKRENNVLCGDFKVNIEQYISKLVKVPTGVKNLTDLIAFNTANADKELIEPYWTDQSTFIKSEKTPQDKAYFDALAFDYETGRANGIDGALKEFSLDAILIPTNKASRPAAIAGYPVISVPLGFQPPDVVLPEPNPTRASGPNMPFGIAFLGTAYSEFNLVKFAYAYEQATKTRLKLRAYPEAIPKTQLKDVIGK
ncbi:uncharacterized protein FIBRA_02862 [Fibroporia radiculosa]|uniref:Enoyl reductase (ER) domain-containing protein n=1 Tax=Fibroporia radiculosa TaxID=599839 RepID=J4GN59_9APHY|nr:uncharacterized protein FIBRA_02862 [Fibroporia radiculosa]CCM00820.1 predicted protein [Fibroporia radiculosa]